MTLYMKDLQLYSENHDANKNSDIIHSKIPIHDAEGFINKILDKHKETCKYYINCNDNYWGVSFNADPSQYEIMFKSMFEIHLFNSVENTAICLISKEINEYEQWGEVKRDLLNRIK